MYSMRIHRIDEIMNYESGALPMQLPVPIPTPK